MSMVRFLVYSNQFDVEGLVATTSIHQQDKVAAWRIREIVDAYGKVRDNLERHETGFPTADALRAVIVEGPARIRHAGRRQGTWTPRLGPAHRGRRSRRSAPALGAGLGRPERARAGAVEGARDALAGTRSRRSSPSCASTRSPIRTTAVRGSARTFPASSTSPAPAFTAAAPITTPPGAASAATSSTAASRAPTSPSSTTRGSTSTSAARARWARSIDVVKFLMEGDTPSFLGSHRQRARTIPSIPTGAAGAAATSSTRRACAKWFAEPETRPFWTDAEDEVHGQRMASWHTSNQATIWRWRDGVSERLRGANGLDDQAATTKPTIRRWRSSRARISAAKPGERVNLSAAGSTDPDGNALSYEWFYYGEAGTFSVQSRAHRRASRHREAKSPQARRSSCRRTRSSRAPCTSSWP